MRQKLLAALLATMTVLSLGACANNPFGSTTRENSTPSSTETNSGRAANPQFPVGSRNSAPD